METVAYEDAARCPKCGHTGELKQSRPGPDKSEIHILTCQNRVCLWYLTDWIVQRMSDGTVPIRPSKEEEPRRPKTFPKLPGTPEKYLQGLEATKDELPPDPTSKEA